MRQAIVLGATGLVGTALLHQLLEDNSYGTVKIFTRRSTNMRHPKIEEHIVNFDEPHTWKHLVTGDVLFSAFGTTLKKAGSKEAQYRIDYTYQYNTAKAAAENGVPTYILISAAGSSANSPVFYSKMKGELERDVKELTFEHIHILRPGLLSGSRPEPRAMEKVADVMLQAVSAIPGLHSLKPIKSYVLARAMRHAALDETTPLKIYNPKEIFKLANY
jgi:uncharacterized protein YbjT (DUF2867 family)